VLWSLACSGFLVVSVATGILLLLYVVLIGPVAAIGLAALYSLRRDWRPDLRRGVPLLATAMVSVWASIAGYVLVDAAKRLVSPQLNEMTTGSAVGAVALGACLAYAERSWIPLWAMSGAACVCIVVGVSFPTPPLSFALAAMVLNMTFLTLAFMNHRVIRSRVRLDGRCVNCKYLAYGLARCPECGGAVNPARGPVGYDARLDA
jgi:hypothetical protein